MEAVQRSTQYEINNKFDPSNCKIGLIINPVAGIGGAVGLKGSDGIEVQTLAMKRGAVPHAADRTRQALEKILPYRNIIRIYAAPGPMGEELVNSMGFDTVRIGSIKGDMTVAADTEAIAKLLAEHVDLMVFAGGDGTARNICTAVGMNVPVVGIPAGVKIHSPVYAKSPAAAGEMIAQCISKPYETAEAEVIDLDEDKYREGVLSTRLFGYMNVPRITKFMQNPKAASHNSLEDVGGICFEIKDRMSKCAPDTHYILGAGSTVNAIKRDIGIDATLVGVDVVCDGKLISKDVTEHDLVEITKKHECRLIITAIGGQGHIFGRGNQQISPQVIRQIGKKNIWIVATSQKLFDLDNQDLYVDTGDEEMNDELRGYIRVITGWQDEMVCRVL